MNAEYEGLIEQKLKVLFQRAAQLSPDARKAYLRQLETQAFDRLSGNEEKRAAFAAALSRLRQEFDFVEPTPPNTPITANARAKKGLFLTAGFVTLLAVGTILYVNSDRTPASLVGQKGNSENTDISPAETLRTELYDQATQFTAAEGNSITKLAEDGVLQMRSKRTEAAAGGTTQGVYLSTSDEFANATAGKTVKVEIVAKLSETNPSDIFRAAFSTASIGNSGWKEFLLEEEFKSFTFEYDVPDRDNRNGDFVGIWADPLGQDGGVDIKSVRISILK